MPGWITQMMQCSIWLVALVYFFIGVTAVVVWSADWIADTLGCAKQMLAAIRLLGLIQWWKRDGRYPKNQKDWKKTCLTLQYLNYVKAIEYKTPEYGTRSLPKELEDQVREYLAKNW